MANEVRIAEARKTWEAAAPGWAKWEKAFSRGLEPATDILLDMARVVPGSRVLDVASGAGAQTLQTARRVGMTGEVVASDISDTMLDNVRRSAEEAGLTNVSTVASPAEQLTTDGRAFDAAICRLGLMLFPGPASAVSTIGRLLRRSGRLAGLVFTTPASNPFMAAPMAILLRHAGKQPPAPGQPGIFALGGDGALSSLFSDNGLTDVETRVVRSPLKLGCAEDALQMIQQAFGAYRAVIAGLGDEERAAAWEDVLGYLKQFESGSGFETEFEFIIASGAAP